MALLSPPRIALPLLLTAALSLGGGEGSAQALGQEEALRLAFPEAEVERRTAFLTEAELEEVAELVGAGVETGPSIVTYYVASRGGLGVGVAYFDAHRVRTLDQVLMVVVDGDGRVARVETVAFREPPEYRAPEGWLRLFDGRALDGELRVRRAIPNITGATLTSGAATGAVRRALAVHRVIAPLGDGGR